jgi:hypothetical protein
MNSTDHEHQERIESLRELGYNERESTFLYLAAVHSGYFLRRQFCQFLGKEIGGTAAQLVEKVLAKGHARASVWSHNTKLYHLGARPFYAGFGQVDNRNRRERQPAAIKNKLMALDFVLAHRQHFYLATERDKVNYFTESLGIDSSKLPAKRYRSRDGSRTTTRYFVDKQPVFLSGAGRSGAPPVVSFCYIDEGLASLSRFETFLSQYRPLFGCLPEFSVVYVATAPLHFEIARRVFHSFSGGPLMTSPAGPIDPRTRRLLDYYESRFLYETKQWETFDRAKLVRLRQDRQKHAGPENEGLYDQWKTGGDSIVIQRLEGRTITPVSTPKVSFSAYLVNEEYGFLGSLVSRSSDSRTSTTSRQPGHMAVSDQLSAPTSEVTP